MARLSRTLPATVTGIFDLLEINKETPHTQVAMRFVDGSGDPVTPGAGTFTVSIKPDGSETFQPLQSGTGVDATGALDILTYSAIGETMKYEPTGVTVATSIEFTVGSTTA